MAKEQEPVLEGSHIKQMKPSKYRYVKCKAGKHIFKNKDGELEAFERHKYPVASWQLRIGNAFFEFSHSVKDSDI